MSEICDHTSVGMLIKKDDKYLLIERMKFPFGFAPPAGYLDGDEYEEGARRELIEEVGLNPVSLKLVYEGKKENICRRENGNWHYWKIYEVQVTGKIKRSEDEIKQAGWYSIEQIKNLAAKTKAYLTGKVEQEKWESNPGLESFWYEWFKESGLI